MKYTVVKHPKFKYLLLVLGYIFLNISWLYMGCYIFLREDDKKTKILVFAIFAVIEILILLLIITMVGIKKLFFSTICFSEAGIYANDKLILKWDEIKSSGVVRVTEQNSYSPVTFPFTWPLSFKFMFFSANVLEKKKRKALEYKVSNDMICMQYDEMALCDIKKYYPDFDIEVEYLRN